MKYEVKDVLTGQILFTMDIEATESMSDTEKLDLAIDKFLNEGDSLSRIDRFVATIEKTGA